MFPEEIPNQLRARRLEAINKRPINTGNSAFVHHPFHFSIKTGKIPKTYSDLKEETRLVNQVIVEMLSKGAITITENM